MAPIVEGNTASEAINIQNNNNGIVLSEEVVHLDSLPEDIKELCNASLKVNIKLRYSPTEPCIIFVVQRFSLKLSFKVLFSIIL